MPTPTQDNRSGIFQDLRQTAASPYTRSEYIRRAIWIVLAATLVRWSPKRTWGWRNIWLRLLGARVHPRGGISPKTRIVHPWLLDLGASVIAENVVIYNLGPVSIGDDTVISHDAYLCAGTHDHTSPSLPLLRPAIRIGSGVWIGMGAFIGPGVTIGDNSIVGARAVVMRDVPPGVIVAGNPARVIKPRPLPPGMIGSDASADAAPEISAVPACPAKSSHAT
jgi:putative colanic acid biosynthesis acetyltransferase WcaF